MTTETQSGVYSMFFTAFGSVSAAPSGSGYAGTLTGSFDVMTLPGPWDYSSDRYERRAVCQSAGHRFVLTR